MRQGLEAALTARGITAVYKKASEFTTFKIGGECFVVYPQTDDELVTAIRYCAGLGVKYTVVGAGSNVLFPDGGYDGAVLLTSRLRGIATEGNTVTARCGDPLHAVCRAAYDNGLTGLEFAYGIPGTVGGAVFMNAGAYGREMKDAVDHVKVYSCDLDEIITYGNEECGFDYRRSRFSDGKQIILSAGFKLTAGDRTAIKAEMDDLIRRRKEKQPLEYPSAGSVFKRYPGRYTGQMIEQAGLKGYSVGAAAVSEKHAGFIINTGGATAKDVLALIDHIRTVIYEREGVCIECEIRVVE